MICEACNGTGSICADCGLPGDECDCEVLDNQDPCAECDGFGVVADEEAA